MSDLVNSDSIGKVRFVSTTRYYDFSGVPRTISSTRSIFTAPNGPVPPNEPIVFDTVDNSNVEHTRLEQTNIARSPTITIGNDTGYFVTADFLVEGGNI